MAIFPKKPGSFSPEPSRAVRELADYLRYMIERLEFAAETLEKRLRELENR